MSLHPLTENLVDEFAASLKAKLAAAEVKYGYTDNWRRNDWKERCQADLAEHVLKGDPLDVAAFCAFMWHHRWPTAEAGVIGEPQGGAGDGI